MYEIFKFTKMKKISPPFFSFWVVFLCSVMLGIGIYSVVGPNFFANSFMRWLEQNQVETNDHFNLAELIEFSDLPEDHWSIGYVNDLVQLGVIQGYDDRTFKPEQAINRAEFTKMTLRALEIEISETVEMVSFQDFSPSDWFAPYVEQAQSLGIIDGYSDHTFQPAKSINRAEALKIILEAAGFDLGDFLPNFDDVVVGTWMASYIGFAQEYEIVSGYGDGTFGPGNSITRAEASKVIMNVLNFKEEMEAVDDEEDDGEVDDEVEDETGDDEEEGDTVGGDDDETEDVDEGGGGSEGEDEVDETEDDDDGSDGGDVGGDDLDDDGGVDGDEADDEIIYSCDWVWPQIVLDATTSESLWGCTTERPYCELGTTNCCKYDANTEEHYDCMDCQDGGCTEGVCAGVHCNDYCDGDTSYYAGECSGGDCNYSSKVCMDGCVNNGVCNEDVCTGVTCEDYCAEEGLYYDGECIGGSCQDYSLELCEFGCDEETKMCTDDLCEGVTCPSSVCEGDFRYYDGFCQGGECAFSSMEGCEFGCNADIGECNSDPCAGVSCPAGCAADGITRLQDGTCVAGECVYIESACDAFCVGGVSWGELYGYYYYDGVCVNGETGPGCSYTVQECDGGCTEDETMCAP